MSNIACIIVGIDGYEKYTLPLVESIARHEPECRLVVVDNASEPRYAGGSAPIVRTKRLCYSAAINRGAEWIGIADWYIVLSNDVLCTGPFAAMLETAHEGYIVGPRYMSNQGYSYLEGWCVCIPRAIWDAVGGWDENFRLSSWEDVDYSYMAREAGFNAYQLSDLPFTHLDQRQRHAMPTFWQDDAHNYRYFCEKRERRAVGQVGWRRQPYVPATPVRPMECHQ